jgi:hypothetical protein
MYLHIGGEYMIKKDSIIGIFDLENTTISKITKEYLTDKEKTSKVITVNEEMPKTFIVSNNNNITKVYITSISSKTLEKRIKTDI